MTHLKFSIFFSFFFACLFCIKPHFQAFAAYSTDNTNGIYTDDFANTTGINSRVGVGVSGGFFKLSNGTSGFTAPFFSTGNLITKNIAVFSISKWNTLDIAATIPAGTSIKVQILDDVNVPYSDTFLPNNSVGNSNFPLDISGIPPLYSSANANKQQVIRLKFILSTGDTGFSPLLNSATLTWTVRQGDTTPSALDNNGNWPMVGGNRQKTFHTTNYNSSTYPTFNWVSSKIMDSFMAGEIYVTDNKVVSFNAVPEGYLTVLNKTDGSISSNIPYNRCDGPAFVFNQSGTFFGHDYGCDLMYAFDSSNGQIKWSNNFYGGHSNDDTAIGNDGTIYEVRNATVGLGMTLYAFNQGGTIKWTKDIVQQTRENDNDFLISPFSMSPDGGTLYFSTYTEDVDYYSTGHGELYAVNTTDGTVFWHHLIPDSNTTLIVDTDGTIYLGTYQMSNDLNIKDIIAYNPDGSVKWTTGRTADTTSGYNNFRNGTSLRSDGVLLTTRDNVSHKFVFNAYNTSNGQQLWESSPLDGIIQFSDGLNGFYFSDVGRSSGIGISRINYSDSNYQTKWRLATSYTIADGSNEQSYDLNYISPGNNGLLYGSFSRSYYDSHDNEIYGQGYTQYYSLKPWTLSASIPSSNYHVGETINFVATSSMGTTNPLFGGNNLVQVFFDNNQKLVLNPGSTDSSGNTIWTGTYTIPLSLSLGAHTYTIEASQPHLQTDITTHFDSAPTQSDNTGIATTGVFNLSQVTIPVSVGETINTTNLFNTGVLSVPVLENPTSTSQINANSSLHFEVSSDEVIVPESTTITSTSSLPFDATKLQASLPPLNSITPSFPDAQVIAGLQWGIPNVGLQFSQPLTMSIFVGTQYNGQTLTLLRSVNGVNSWTSDGFVSPNSCVISNGYCTFQTTKASYFVVKTFDTPVINNTPSVSNSSCEGPKPLTPPDLFQVNVNNTTAKLFFTPISNTNNYYISFSTKATAEDYGVDVVLAREGVQNYTIEQLKPNTTYYIKIRGKNGCTPGDWSNTFKITTRGKKITKTVSLFKKNQPKINLNSTVVKKAVSTIKNIISKKDTLLNPQSTSTFIDTPSTPQITQPATPITQPTPAPKKFCLLWWCI